MQITMCLSPLPPPLAGREPRPADHFCMPATGEKPTRPASSAFTGTPGPGNPARMSAWRQAWASARARHLAPARQNQASRHFHPMDASSPGGGRQEASASSSSPGVSLFPILLQGREGRDTDPRWLNVALQGWRDGGDRARKTTLWSHTHSPLQIHIHLFISQTSTGTSLCPGHPCLAVGSQKGTVPDHTSPAGLQEVHAHFL